MPRPAKGPRLYLRRRAGREPVYVILDGPRELVTGCGPDRAGEAGAALHAYLAAKYTPPAKAGAGLADILIADVIAAYVAERGPHVANRSFVAATAGSILDWWSTRTLADVKGQACRDYVTWRTAQRVRNSSRAVSAATARHDLKTLRAAIHHWHRENGPLPAVPAVTLPPAPPPRERWLTRDEAARAIRAARKARQAAHLVRLILIGVYTGTRPGAVLRLSWLPQPHGGWIDVEAGVLHRQGPGDRRSRKRQPPVRIPPRLLAHLARWRAMDLAGETTGRQRRQVARVVHYYGKPVAKLRRAFASLMRAAGIGAGPGGVGSTPTPHTLRHTAVTWAMQGGCDLYEAAGYFGMSVQTLEDVYGHHHPDWQIRAATGARGRRKGTDTEPAQETPKQPPSLTVDQRPPSPPNALKRHGNA
jgi:integrase